MLALAAHNPLLQQLALVPLTMSAASTFVAMYAALAALAPRLTQARESLRSFPDAARLAPEAYVTRQLALDCDAMRDDLARHNAILCRIADRKFLALGLTVRALKTMLISSAGVVVLYLVAEQV